jgi:hypothetical protein
MIERMLGGKIHFVPTSALSTSAIMSADTSNVKNAGLPHVWNTMRYLK